MKNPREIAKFILKLGVGAAVVTYVLHSRMIDFEAMKSILFSPWNLLIVMAMLNLSAACCALRWYQLSRVQGLSLSRFTMYELIMIGSFFNTFMPGAVGGDVIKAWYVAGREPARKMRAVYIMFLDRVLGLAVIVFYAAFTLVFYRQWLPVHPELKWLAAGIWGFSSACLLFGGLFFLSRFLGWSFLDRLLHRLERWPRLHDLLQSTFAYRNHFGVLLLALTLSAVSILGQNVLYKIQGDLLGIPMDIAHYLFIVPVVMTVSAVPILPGGIGVGQVAFFKLFEWTGMANPQQGATLCTVMQVYTILFNCTGAFFYLRFRRQPTLAPGLSG